VNEPHLIAVPGRVLGSDIEDQAAELAGAAARLAALVAAFGREPGARQADVAALARRLGQARESMAAAAAGLQFTGDRDTGMEIRALSADQARDVLLTLSDRLPGEVARALDDCAATWLAALWGSDKTGRSNQDITGPLAGASGKGLSPGALACGDAWPRPVRMRR